MQLTDGLSSCQLLQSIQKYPDVWKPLFQPSNIFDITADKFLDDAVVVYSSSQLMKEMEENTYKIFCDVILLLDEGNIVMKTHNLNLLLIATIIARQNLMVGLQSN